MGGRKLFGRGPAENVTRRLRGPGGAVDAPYLSVQSGLHAGQNLKLKTSTVTNIWDIGSDPDRDIVVDDDGVSAFHAKIVNEGARWKLIDQMSANGTFVNGHKSNISFLASGDRIRLGPIECVFQLPAAADQRPTAAKRPAWTIAVVARRHRGAAGSAGGCREVNGWRGGERITGEYVGHRREAEVTQQRAQFRFAAAKVGVVTQARLQRRGYSRLVGIEFPRMQIEHERFGVAIHTSEQVGASIRIQPK
jgi:pSer/pThr/pTyr-binding forkhead associated (FHA) protein